MGCNDGDDRHRRPYSHRFGGGNGRGVIAPDLFLREIGRMRADDVRIVPGSAIAVVNEYHDEGK